jgi:polar amino acid transport system substrate-binding protein
VKILFKNTRLIHLKTLLSLKLLFIFLLATKVYAQQDITILTDVWPPYINVQEEKSGTAAKLIEVLLDYEEMKTQWHYLPYELSYYQVKEQKALLSYPYFKTPQRANEVLFSDPVFSVTSKVYYNRQFLTAVAATKAYKNKQRVGKVAGYSYGSSIDESVQQATTFSTEKQALTALFNNDISLLPMTEGVMEHKLTTLFPLRKQLIVSIDNVMDTSSLHVIASKNEQGKAAINKLNKTLSYLKAEGITSLQMTSTVAPDPIDVAKLITSEGYPLIIGQTKVNGDNIEYYALPQGSQALIIEWSRKIIQPSATDRIYKNMMDLSKVVLLNGPHVGKELYIRNMHIELL